MTSEQSALERGKILGMVFMGCDVDVAANTVGWTAERLAEESRDNPEFAKELAERAGLVELHHMRNVHKAAEDAKYWRASAWWLSQRAAERRKRKSDGAFTTIEIQVLFDDLMDAVFDTVTMETDRDRLIGSLLKTASDLDRQKLVAMVGEPALLEALERAEDSNE